MQSLTLSLILFLSVAAYSQHGEVNFYVGSGAHNAALPIHPDESDVVLSTGCDYLHYIGKKQMINVQTGLNYQISWYSILQSLRVPLGVNFDFGQRFHGGFGMGVYFKSMLNFNSSQERFNRFIPGVYADLGMGYRLSQQLDISLHYSGYLDLTSYYNQSAMSPGGIGYSSEYYDFVTSFRIALAYRLYGRQKGFEAR